MRRCGRRWQTEEEALRSKRGLTGLYEPVRCRSGCGGVHLKKRQPQKDTGPSRKVRALVLERDGWSCVSCDKPVGLPGTWWSLQHRLARGVGGDNSPSNLIALCGSATSPGCHRRCEDRDEEMRHRGYWLRSDDDPPALVPVMYFSPHGSGFTAWLCDDGSLIFEQPARSA